MEVVLTSQQQHRNHMTATKQRQWGILLQATVTALVTSVCICVLLLQGPVPQQPYVGAPP